MIEIILAVIVVVQLLIIIHLKFKSIRYDGRMLVEETDEGKKIFSLNLNGDPMELVERESVMFKVVSNKD